jgi:hypothetical protein
MYEVVLKKDLIIPAIKHKKDPQLFAADLYQAIRSNNVMSPLRGF